MWLDAGPANLPNQPTAAAVATAEAFYGGPDLPPRVLRNLLLERIEAAPAGSEILWATYYFRDRGLADALVAAHRRGVRVRVVLDGQPRRRRANAAVIEQLRRGLGPGLRVYRPLIPGARLHAKIYAFSGPTPQVFVGSFNPSGDQPEDPAVLADIGDQDRGHNLLVRFRDPRIVHGVHSQADRIWRGQPAWRNPFRPDPVVDAGGVKLFYFPRRRTEVVEASLIGLARGDRVRAAVSHLQPGPLAARLAAAARDGADVQLIVHDTERRVPTRLVARLADAGVQIRRYCHADGLPMHAKFLLVERDGRPTAWFGSLNFNGNSQFLNQEILVRSREPRLIASLNARFEQIRAESLAQRAGQPRFPPLRASVAWPTTARLAFSKSRHEPILLHGRACGPTSGAHASLFSWFWTMVARLRAWA